MKKLVSFLLAVCMCLSVGAMLTSCGHEHTWNDGEITTPATATADGVKTFTCTECGETKTESVTLKTTVTEEEWKNLFILTNCTVNGNYTEGQEETLTITVANNQCIATTIEPDETDSFYIFLKDGVWYGGETGVIGLICWEMENTSCIILGDIFEMFEDFENKFSEFTYNSEKKAYVMNTTGDRIEVYIENGHIAKILCDEEPDDEAPTHTFIFSDYGTTVIDNFPEFCFEHNFDVNWSYDTSSHWKQCINEGCGKATDFDKHTNCFNSDPECEICGYVKE